MKKKTEARWKNWGNFLLVMTQKELRVKYKMTLFGFFWAFITPVIQMLVMGYVFSFIVPVKTENYFVFIISGLILWNFLSSSVLRSVTIIINERSLIQKSSFPKEILVLAVVATNLIHMLISFCLLLVVVIFLGVLRWQWLLLPLGFLPLIMLASGLSLFLAALNTKRRDVNFITQIITGVWFYLTPIVYTLDIIPSNQVFWFGLNPMVGIIDITRWFFLGLPSNYLYLDLFSLGLSVIVFGLGLWVFNKMSLYFNEWV